MTCLERREGNRRDTGSADAAADGRQPAFAELLLQYDGLICTQCSRFIIMPSEVRTDLVLLCDGRLPLRGLHSAHVAGILPQLSRGESHLILDNVLLDL